MERRLVAILVADIVGYAGLVERDETAAVEAVALLEAQAVRPLIARHRGRLFKTVGDGFLAEFGSAVNALACAEAWQRRTCDADDGADLVFRIGLHVGDVLVSGDDLLGDGVNIAARLEALAPPGGLAMSAEFVAQTRERLEGRLRPLGERRLKSLERSVEVWLLPPELTGIGTGDEPPTPRDEGASVAVLPFASLSADAADRIFAEGVADELATSLGQVPWFFVSAAASYGAPLRDLSHARIGEVLGVRYLVDGAAQRAGERLRVTVRLIEAATGRQLWSHRFEGAPEEVFVLQDSISRSVIGQIEPRLRRLEIQRSASRHGTASAYDCYLQALPLIRSMHARDHDLALERLHEALRFNPDHAAAHGLIAWLTTLRIAQGAGADLAAGIAHAERAIACGPFDCEAMSTGGYALGFLRRDPALGIGYLRDAIPLNPNSARSHDFLGWLLLYAGEPREAREHFDQSMELSPIEDFAFRALTGRAFAQLFLGDLSGAVTSATRALAANPGFTVCHRVLAPALAASGQVERAREVVADLRARHPTLTVARFAEETRFETPAFRRILLHGLAAAGLPAA